MYDIHAQHPTKPPRILVVRRDNIGDLVCTTPLIRALRERFPQAWIGAMVNSYNAPVLDGNTDLDDVYVYTKAKHRGNGESLIGIFWRRWQMMRALRAMHIDDVIVATTGPQPRTVASARWLKPRRIIGFGSCGADVELPLATAALHEVEDVFRIAALYGIERPPPPCIVEPPGSAMDANLIAIHISARKTSQRWPAENHVALLRELHAQNSALRFLLLWSPGTSNDPRHPGDDAKAAAIVDALGRDFPFNATATPTLQALISALSPCAALICSDGGAMHLAAGLGLPIIAMFGDSSIERWRPWGVPHRVLQAPSRDVADISPADVSASFNALQENTRVPTGQG